jgi:hypothetical protein
VALKVAQIWLGAWRVADAPELEAETPQARQARAGSQLVPRIHLLSHFQLRVHLPGHFSQPTSPRRASVLVLVFETLLVLFVPAAFCLVTSATL